MTKINKVLYKRLKTELIQTLYDLKNTRDLESFFDSFFTKKEQEIIVKRSATLYFLRKKRDKKNITNNLRVSGKFIDKCKKIINKPGVKLFLKNMEADEWANKWVEKFTTLGNLVK